MEKKKIENKAKKKVTKEVEKVIFDHSKKYDIILKGKEYKVTGEMAQILINKGAATLK